MIERLTASAASMPLTSPSLPEWKTATSGFAPVNVSPPEWSRGLFAIYSLGTVCSTFKS